MPTPESLRYLKFVLANRYEMPALGFGTNLKASETVRLVNTALKVGYRQFDCSERYGNEEQVGHALVEAIATGQIARHDLFISTKLWNTNHRPMRVGRAFHSSLNRLKLDYVDLYLIHTPFAFLPSDEFEPRDPTGAILYDPEVTLFETWQALERLVDEGKCRSIGLSDVSLVQLKSIYEQARIKPAVVQIESHPYLPQWELLDYCRVKKIVLQAFCPFGHRLKPDLLEDNVIVDIAKAIHKSAAQVLIAWALQRGTAPLTSSNNPSHIKENFDVAFLPPALMREIKEGIATRFRYNRITETGLARSLL